MKNKRTEGKIKSHYGMTDYYKYFKKTYDLDISKTIYNKIIEDFNKDIRNLLIEENLDYKIPYLGSTLSIRKVKRSPRIVNGKVYNPNPIDWKTTNELWDKDEEAKEKKLLVRYNNSHTSGYVFRVAFKKYDQVFKNKKLYAFKSLRDLNRMIKYRINDETKDKFNAYLLY